MSKKNNKPAPSPIANPNLPEGFESINDDIVGIWEPDSGTILKGYPLHVVLSDPKKFKDTKRSSILLFWQLTTECPVRSGEDVIDAQPGDIIGVWYKPGMKKIVQCAGVETAMYLAGEKDVGKGEPMKVFTIATRGGVKGSRVHIEEDHRKETADYVTAFHDDVSKGDPSEKANAVDDVIPRPFQHRLQGS